MKNKKLHLIFVSIVLISFSAFAQNKAEDSKYFSKDIVSKVEDPHTNLNLLWSDYLVTIRKYNLWGEINESNYQGIDMPFIDEWTETNTVIIDHNTFYYVVNRDTILCQEEVFTDNIEGKTIKITPFENNKNINFKVSVAVEEYIKQFLSAEDYGRDGVEDKEALLETWEKVSPFKAVKDSAQFYFKIPNRESLSDIKQIKVDLALGDTTLYYEAEGGGHDLNYIYKGKPAEHRIIGMLIRIEKYKKDLLIETKYIQFSFPQSC